MSGLLRRCERALQQAGWTYAGKTASGHHKYAAPPGFTGRPFFVLPSTPGRGRATQNMQAQLKRVCGITLQDGT